MDDLTFIFIFILLLILLYFNMKDGRKIFIMRGNLLVQSKPTSKVLGEMQLQEVAEQEQRLLKNPRYKAMRGALNIELDQYRTMALAEAKITFQNAKLSKRVIIHDGHKFLLKIDSTLDSVTSPALHFIIRPVSFFGHLFSIDEWIRYRII